MKPCSSCRRHLRRTERECPFCGAPCREAAAPVVAVLVLASALVGCTEGMVPPEQADGSSSTTAEVSSSTSETSGTTAAASGTTAAVSASGVVEGSSSGGTTTAVDEGTTACSADEGSVFIYGPPPECRCPDPPPHCDPPSLECDVLSQDCPVGEKCMPWGSEGGAWDATRCVPVAPDPDQPGEPCTVEGSPTSGVDSCDLGSMCWDVDDETLAGTCVAMCTGTIEMPICEEEGTVCAINNDDVLVLCLPACDPLAQDCSVGEGCYPIQSVWACVPDASEGSGYGAPCAFVNVCAPGLVCVDSGAVPPGEACEGEAGCCTEICDVADPAGDMQCTGAPGGQICEPWYDDGRAPAGLEDVGVCTLP
jgi:hypothetical protein